MKIISFNVNGIKSFDKFIKQNYNLSFNDYLLKIMKADILCLQEIKCTKKDMEEFSTLKDFITLTNFNQKTNGIYGVSTFVSKRLYCRRHNISVPYSEYGRSLLTDHKNFKILNLYCPFYDPNGNKTKESVIKFYRDIYNFISKYDDLIVLGDFNATYSIFDHYIYYNEFKKNYNRKNKGQDYVLEILETYSNDFKNQTTLKNYKKLCDSQNFTEDEVDINIKNNNTMLSQLFGKNILLFMYSYKTNYLNYIYSSINNLQNATFSFSRESYNCDVDYSIDLMEKTSCSLTELPYLVENNATLLLLFYSTFQRKWMLKFILELSHIDAFRLFHTGYEKYTCWNIQLNLRPRNLGSRIDYILIPIKFYNRIMFSDIENHVYGSDHCPVYVNLNLETVDDKDNICKSKNNLLGFLKRY
ncbi:exodeoxyribonuclease iii [Vairimorpha ceranae]|uniref:Exodeoxyribonuclease iii n=1 Tax=Vairimorpha ceranae TaxID=40302 RepID=A0A0F9WHV1_9MICR|nr:exodeoxyribonuclease iii [Vairimorpha ceranae]KAF5140050.1 hypothetical protein G9O61_00g017750 [Vairimorpha ceranae]KKO76180.1 exodeoxyribonuclease iii [Vairimorpha ceranae]